MNIWDIPPVVLNDELCICLSEDVRQCPEEWYCRAGSSKCSSTSPQQVAQMPSASRKRSKCSCRTKKQQREAAERRRTFIISRRVWSEGWSWVKSEAVRKPTQLHLISFNFLKRWGWGWGWGEWFSQQQSRRKRKVLKEGEESELYGIFPRGGPFFDGKTPFLFPLVD